MGLLSKKISTAILIGLTLGCVKSENESKETVFHGDLYFKLVSIGSLYNADSLMIDKISSTLDSLTTINTSSLSSNDENFISIYDGLRRHGLIYKPSFHLRIDSLTNYIVYADTTKYKKINDFNLQELINENKKVSLSLIGNIVELGRLPVIDCERIDVVELVEGKTYWKK